MSPTNVLVSPGPLSADAAEICDIKASREQDLDLQILPSILCTTSHVSKEHFKEHAKDPSPERWLCYYLTLNIGQKRVRSNEQLTEIITSE